VILVRFVVNHRSAQLRHLRPITRVQSPDLVDLALLAGLSLVVVVVSGGGGGGGTRAAGGVTISGFWLVSSGCGPGGAGMVVRCGAGLGAVAGPAGAWAAIWMIAGTSKVAGGRMIGIGQAPKT
jgi:hypothetical protein